MRRRNVEGAEPLLSSQPHTPLMKRISSLDVVYPKVHDDFVSRPTRTGGLIACISICICLILFCTETWAFIDPPLRHSITVDHRHAKQQQLNAVANGVLTPDAKARKNNQVIYYDLTFPALSCDRVRFVVVGKTLSRIAFVSCNFFHSLEKQPCSVADVCFPVCCFDLLCYGCCYCLMHR